MNHQYRELKETGRQGFQITYALNFSRRRSSQPQSVIILPCLERREPDLWPECSASHSSTPACTLHCSACWRCCGPSRNINSAQEKKKAQHSFVFQRYHVSIKTGLFLVSLAVQKSPRIILSNYAVNNTPFIIPTETSSISCCSW